MGHSVELCHRETMRNVIRYNATLPPAIGGLQFAPGDEAGVKETRGLKVDVLYTTDAGTRLALERAWQLAQNLGAHVRLVFIYVVPFTLPLEKPAVSLPFLEDKLSKLASGFSGEASVHIYLCRETRRALSEVLSPSCPVVLGGRRRWWHTKEQRLERRLRKLGRQVIFKELR